MAVLARRVVPCDPALAWRVVSDIAAWPAWVDSIESVATEHEKAESEQDVLIGPAGYRITQPPLPSALWTITRWEEGACFQWESRGVSTVVSERFELIEVSNGTSISIDVTWSGPTTWFARAAFGPVRQRYAGAQLAALANRVGDC